MVKVLPSESLACISLGQFSLEKSGLKITGESDYESWLQVGHFLTKASESLMWWVGDWLNYGEKRYGETYEQAIEATGLDYQTLKNAKWLSGLFELSLRKDNLSFSHHLLVAALPISQRQRLLDKADSEGWSVRDLRAKLTHKQLKSSGWSDIVGDPSGQPVPPPLKRLFVEFPNIKASIIGLSKLKLNQDAQKAIRVLRKIGPGSICPDCSGFGCDFCIQSGWLSIAQFEKLDDDRLAQCRRFPTNSARL